MADDIAVHLRHLSKKYRLFASKRHRLLEALHPWRVYHREFWALRDITLDIPRGSTVGILGLNGSGKSTLLQIISSVLQPTAGTVEVDGRVAALLELGAGFNPELTGRENVVMNGTIMGLGREQIAERMGDIERFADIGEFFDQPVRTYSSGMFMRVAFASAIHVDPDVLIIDEALSVGDAKFQEKCFRRFRAFQEAGKTILFVSHDRAAVPRYCDLGILLHQGTLLEVGPPGRIAELYGEILAFGRLSGGELPAGAALEHPAGAAEDGPADSLASAHEGNAVERFARGGSREDRCRLNPTYNQYEHRFGNGHAAIIDYLMLGPGGENPTQLTAGERAAILIKVHFHEDVASPIVGVVIKNKEGVTAFGVNSDWTTATPGPAAAGSVHLYRFTIRLDLCMGDWFVDLAVAESRSEMCDSREAIAHLYLTDQRVYVGLARLDADFSEVQEPG